MRRAILQSLPDGIFIQGELQSQLMSVLWRLGSATVDQVRGELRPTYEGAYTTVQTVLNRLAQRGLVSRRRVGSAIEYRPRVSEDEWLTRSIVETLAGASSDSRRTVLARLITSLDPDELRELKRLANELSAARAEHRSMSPTHGGPAEEALPTA